MAIPKPASLKDFFNFIGGSITALTPANKGFSLRTQTLPNNGGQYQSPVPAQPVAPAAPAPAPAAPAPVAAAPAPTSAPIFSSAKSAAPTAQKGPVQVDIPPQWLRPDGSLRSPDDVAQLIVSSAPKTASQSGDIAKYAGDQFSNKPQTVEQIMTQATLLNNARNDMATGETDPFGVASKSGIPYTPAELGAIEKAYAGVYDPAISSALAKLETKQKEEEDQRQFEQDLQKMEKQFEYDKKLKMIVAPGSGGSGSSNQIIDNERAAQTLFQQNPIVKDYNTVVSQKNAIDNIIANGVGGPADVSAVFTFMKALDPNSVVRESEFDKAAKSGNLFQGYYKKFNGYFKDKGGFLPDNVKDEFLNLINQKLQAQKTQYDNVANQTRAIVQRQGLNPDNVVIDFSGGIQNIGNNSGAGGPPADWLSTPNYTQDISDAKAAIAAGADPAAVKARLLTKYKEVEL